MFEIILLVFLGLVSLVAAVYALLAPKLLNAILASGVVSMNASIVFLLVAAPDVAMTEATIGSALTTVVFLYALKHIKQSKGGSDD